MGNKRGPEAPPDTPRHQVLAALAAATALGCLAVVPYLGTLQASFLAWDDGLNVAANRGVLAGDWRSFWLTPYAGLYIPLVYTLWTFLAKIGLSAVVFHAANLSLHAVNTVLVAALFMRLQTVYAAPRFAGETSAGRGDQFRLRLLPAGVVGLVFAWHPLQTETVAWVSGFRDLSCTFFGLLAVLSYTYTAKYTAGAGPGFVSRTKSLIAYAVASTAFLCSLLCKPAAVVLPLVLMILALGLWRCGREGALRLATGALLWLVAALPVIIATARIQTETVAPTVLRTSLSQRMYVALDALGFYAGKVFWPAGLAADYGRLPEAVLQAQWSLAATIAVVILAVAALVVVAAWRGHLRRWLCLGASGYRLWTGLLAALLLLLPTLGLVPFAFQRISTVSDRYMYLPLVGLAIAAGALVELACELVKTPAYRWLRPKILATSIAALALLTFAALSAERSHVWRDDTAFLSAMLAANPASFSALSGLGTLAFDRGDISEALAGYEGAVALQPTNVLALANLGLVLDRLGRYRDVLTRVAPLVPDAALIARSPLSAAGVARMLEVIGFAQVQLGDVAAGTVAYCRAVRLDPTNAPLQAAMAEVRRRGAAGGLALPSECEATADGQPR